MPSPDKLKQKPVQCFGSCLDHAQTAQSNSWDHDLNQIPLCFIFTLVHIAPKYQILLTLKHAWSRYLTEKNMKMSGHPESSSGCLVSSGSASDGYGGMWHDEGTNPPPECLGLTSRLAFEFPHDWDYLVRSVWEWCVRTKITLNIISSLYVGWIQALYPPISPSLQVTGPWGSPIQRETPGAYSPGCSGLTFAKNLFMATENHYWDLLKPWSLLPFWVLISCRLWALHQCTQPL